jgi:hypothetical protein
LPTAGQALHYTSVNPAKRTMTMVFGSARQVIEGINVIGGSYVLNWEGSASATVNGTPRAKGEVFTLLANTNVTVSFSSGSFTEVQLERGTVPTPYEWRPYGVELLLCQRYFFLHLPSFLPLQVAAYTPSVQPLPTCYIPFPTTMRDDPTVVAPISNGFNIGTITITPTPNGIRFSVDSEGEGYARYLVSFISAQAELTA